MIVTVKTVVGNGQVVGFAVESASFNYDTVLHVLVAIEGKPLQVLNPQECEVLTVEPEYGE